MTTPHLNVPPATYTELRHNESRGRYFVRNIRSTYECWKLVRRPGEK